MKNLFGFRKHTGFTLAEVLITLVVIGVVAAMTIPTMVANYQKTQYVTQLKKVYTEISQALQQLKVDEGVSKITDLDVLMTDSFEDFNIALNRAGDGFLKKYFKVVKDCGVEDQNQCWAENVKKLNGEDFGWGMSPMFYCVITVDGTSICVSPGTPGIAGYFSVDINGLKKPNQVGRDIFSFDYYYDGSLDDGASPECRKGLAGRCNPSIDASGRRGLRYENNCFGEASQSYGNGCFAKILNDNWKMDY